MMSDTEYSSSSETAAVTSEANMVIFISAEL